MKGGSRKTRKRKPKKAPKKKVTSHTEVSCGVTGAGFTTIRKSGACSLLNTTKRGRGQTGQTQDARWTSTPVCSSTDNLSSISRSPGAKQAELKYTEFISQLKTSKVDSSCCKSKYQSKCRRGRASQPRQVRKRLTMEQMEPCSKTNGPPAQRRCGRTQKIDTRDMQMATSIQPSQRTRPKFVLAEEEVKSQKDESLLSSDLSIELSHNEELLPYLSFQENEDSGEEEDLPSFLMQVDKKPPSISEGAFVWYKFRNYPFWPGLVKSVNRKQKKASIVLIDDEMIHKKKGFTVPLKTLKSFDCEEANDLVRKAKENYDAAVEWSLELVTDYRIRIACGSFSGSFIEYFAHDMSYPVRRKYPQAVSERLMITSDPMMEELHDDPKDKSFSEQQGEAVIRGQQQSRWLRSFLSASRRRVVNVYLEDDQQLDRVYWYLNELYATAVATAPCPTEVKSMERVPFVLDVLLPEAIIYAIAGVDNVSVKKAEEKYLKGRCISNRERQEFDWMIEQQIRKKSQQNTAPALFTDQLEDCVM
ncbi:PWWP domain-containing DNA repair factor 3B isoform X2 [Mastacembelus armatus]|uniref:PWWP domain-containing DNA repair factor 3B isoform X2 n=1 Tax=Mastacembelus armatus TaxID=205130 RepID=UPI000E45BC4E|nr:PWWP domain-containing DNA repair factor 3B-like isoform X2 [Mastacembelus armatus]